MELCCTANQTSILTAQLSRYTEQNTTMTRPHPLHGITAAEMTKAAELTFKIFGVSDPAERKQQTFRIKSIQINEPPKALLLPYLDAEASGVGADGRPFVPRCVSVIWSRDHDRVFADSIISLDSGTEVKRYSPQPGEHSQLDRSVTACDGRTD